MNIEIHSSKKRYAGLLFMAVGVFFMWQATRYPIGTPTVMGPGFFPLVLAITLTTLGLIAFVQTLRMKEVRDPVGELELAPLFFMLVSVVAFGLLVERAGLVPALFALTVLCCYSRLRTKYVEVLLLYVFIAVLIVGLFVYGVDLPFKVI